MQPGDTITPGSIQPEEPQNTPSPATEQVPDSSPPTPSEPERTPESSPSFYRTEAEPGMPAVAPGEPVSWTASEFIDHQKTPSWYLGLAAVTVVAMGLVYVLTRDYISTGVIGTVAILFGVIAARQPRTLQYQISDHGIQIGDKFFEYALFKSFSVTQDGPIYSITLMPLKRFMTPISMYYDPKDEKKIGNILSDYLPYEERSHDVVDRLMNKIRF